jgi:hypothetical protein
MLRLEAMPVDIVSIEDSHRIVIDKSGTLFLNNKTGEVALIDLGCNIAYIVGLGTDE